jgi:hypothetical protein
MLAVGGFSKKILVMKGALLLTNLPHFLNIENGGDKRL